MCFYFRLGKKWSQGDAVEWVDGARMTVRRQHARRQRIVVQQWCRGRKNSCLFTPFVFTADLLFLLRGEVVLDVEVLADL